MVATWIKLVPPITPTGNNSLPNTWPAGGVAGVATDNSAVCNICTVNVKESKNFAVEKKTS